MDKTEKQVVTGRLVLAIFSAILGMYTFGYNTGVINNPQGVIKEFYNETYYNRHGRYIPDNVLTIMWAFTVAVFAFGGMIGGFMGGWWADKLGRKRGMLCNVVFGVVGGLLMGLSKTARSYEMVIIGRFVIGFNCGLYTGLSPVYTSECAPVRVRGAVGTCNQLAVTVGILSSQVFGLSELLGTAQLWPVVLGITAIPPALQLFLMPLNPDSPSYLLLVKGDEANAIKALQTLRGTTDVSEDIETLRQEQQAQSSVEKMSLLQLLKSSDLRLPLVVSILMHLSQQFSGINCVFYYSRSLFENVGVDSRTASYATLGVGGIMVTMTLVTIPLMDRLGRRTLHLNGLGGMFVFSIVFTIAFTLRNRGQAMQYISIISALMFVVFFASGPGSIPWMIVAELFTQGPRTAAVSIGVLVNWASNFVVGQSFPPLQRALQTYVFLPFTVLIAIFFCLLFKLLPETKNKSIEEITAIFSRGKSLSNPKTKTDMGSDGMEGSYKAYSNPNMDSAL